MLQQKRAGSPSNERKPSSAQTHMQQRSCRGRASMSASSWLSRGGQVIEGGQKARDFTLWVSLHVFLVPLYCKGLLDVICAAGLLS